MSTPYTPRIEILVARAAPYALIVRHGPRYHTCTIGWDLTNDTFTLGQWINARVTPNDLSPDGRHFIYSGYRPWEWQREDGMQDWVAISRTPYLKAIGLWQCGFGGGRGKFIDNRHYQLGINNQTELASPTELELWQDADAGDYSYETHMHRTLNRSDTRDGWTFKRGFPISDLRPKCNLYEKPIANGHVLQYYYYCGGKPVPNMGTRDGDYQLVEAVNVEIIAGIGWHWADAINNRLLWLKNAQLFATSADPLDLQNASLLYDMNDMQFECIAAPY